MIGDVFQAKLRLKELFELRQQMAARNGLAFYRPHKKQGWFHSYGHKTYRYARTGNRFGKSDMGAAEDCAFALGYRPWLPEGDPNRYNGIPRKSTVGIILCTDWKKAEEIFTSQEPGTAQGKLFKFLPADSILRVSKDGTNVTKIIVKSIWGGYSVIRIDTIVAWKQNPLRSESSSYDWIHVDEPVPMKMFNGYARGLMDRNGKVWFTCTPITEPWINSFFRPHRRSPVFKDKPNEYGADRVMIIGSSYDNPYNSKEGMDTYSDSLDPKVRAARLEGEPIENTGLIYYMFSPDHVYEECPEGWASMEQPPRDFTYRYHLDSHSSNPHAVVFAATGPDSRIWIYDEIWLDADPETVAEQIKLCTKDRYVANEWCDPSAFNKQMDRKTTLAETLIELGLILERAAKDPKRGIIETRALLNQKLADGKPRIMVSSKCFNFLREIDGYVWGDPEKRPDKPVDRNDHFMEGFYRLVLGGLDYIPLETFDYNSKPDVVADYITL